MTIIDKDFIENTIGISYDEDKNMVVSGVISNVTEELKCTVKFTDPFPENNNAFRTENNVRIHFHCWSDDDPTTDEADEDGWVPFEDDDAVIVFGKITGQYPNRIFTPIAVTGFISEKKVCVPNNLTVYEKYDGAYVLDTTEAMHFYATCLEPDAADSTNHYIWLSRSYGWLTPNNNFVNVIHDRKAYNEAVYDTYLDEYVLVWSGTDAVKIQVVEEDGTKHIISESITSPWNYYLPTLNWGVGINWCKLSDGGFATLRCYTTETNLGYFPGQGTKYKITYHWHLKKYDEYGTKFSDTNGTIDFQPYWDDGEKSGDIWGKWRAHPLFIPVATDGTSIYADPFTVYDYDPKTDTVKSFSRTVTFSEVVTASMGAWDCDAPGPDPCPVEQRFGCDDEDYPDWPGNCNDIFECCNWTRDDGTEEADGSSTVITRGITMHSGLSVSGTITLSGSSSKWYRYNCDYSGVWCQGVGGGWWPIPSTENCQNCDPDRLGCIADLDYVTVDYPDHWWPYLVHMYDPINGWLYFDAAFQRSETKSGSSKTRTIKYTLRSNIGDIFTKTIGPQSTPCDYAWGYLEDCFDYLGGQTRLATYSTCTLSCKLANRTVHELAGRSNCADTKDDLPFFHTFGRATIRHEDVEGDTNEYYQTYKEDYQSNINYQTSFTGIPQAVIRYGNVFFALKKLEDCSR